MMPDKLNELKIKRFKYLQRLYEKANGNTLAFVNTGEIGQELGFGSQETDQIEMYLADEGLLKYPAFSSVSITHQGVVEIESALSQPEQPTRYFLPVNTYDVGRESNSQRIPEIRDIEQRVFVDLDRIEELRAINSSKFDLQKLVQLCKELNICWDQKCFLAVAMLTRTVLDHVPPIFGYSSFVEVANNISGKSIKESMQFLENSSRKIGDSHLHGQIRNKETLPNETQVDCRSALDVLLAEIVRILK